MKREIYERRVARIVDAAARLKKGEDQLRRKTRGHHARAAKSIDVSSEIFEHLFWTAKNLSFLCDKFVI